MPKSSPWALSWLILLCALLDCLLSYLLRSLP